MTASCSCFSRCFNYDVFLNFRGQDTRKIFVGHLYKALDQKAISTCIDAEELRKGDDISELLICVQESRLSIVVLSQNYASSTWCLKELVEILQCMDTRKQIVVPIFYEIDPSDVRRLKRSFAKAFAEYEHDPNIKNEDLQSWKSALTRVSNLSGWDSRDYRDDSKLIDDIVENIFNKLIHISSSKANSLVGMDTHLKEMELLLCPAVTDVCIIGIWGMGGLGKTTIARALYDRITCKFEHYCFLENVNEGFLKKGKILMQEELLSKILKEKVQNPGLLNRGSSMIMERLGKKKVLLVLDDVDNFSQIETLVGRRSFGSGSRIIITSRDLQSLSSVDATYSPSFLSENEALELFRQHAFRTNQPTGEYNHLLRSVIKYAQGLPLALKVLGAFLNNKSALEWEDVLEKIKKIPHRDIQDVLRTSFEGLDDLEREIFLDIACFFKGISKGYVTKILDGCGFFSHCGLRVLADRALITISDWNMVETHDLLQEMGREIVRQESVKEPGRRSRLWSSEDVTKVLTQNTATEVVEAIFIDFSKLKEVYMHAESFVRMRKLRLLKIHYNSGDDPSDDCKQHMIGDLKFLSHELRLLLWHGFPLKSLPNNFQPNNLVDLDMRYSLIEELWEGTKPLKKLNFINLSHCQYLNRIPDFSEAPNLERLNLEGCVSLLEVHPSISALRKLVFLSLKGCKELKSVSSSSIGMRSLKILNLSGCSCLEKFPEISVIMKELSELSLDDTAIKELPTSINNLTGLVTLNLRDCKKLEILPSSIHMKSLKHLYLSGCSNLKTFPEISEVMELSQLYLDETAIKELPSSIDRLQGLEMLSMSNCRSLLYLPDTICNLANLTELYLAGCSGLCNLPENLGKLEFLRDLEVEGSGITQLPFSILRLKFEKLSCAGCKGMMAPFSSWPSPIQDYSSYSGLQVLNLSDCNLLELSDSIAHLSSLHTLELRRNNLESLPATMNQLVRLTHLNVEACKSLKSIPELSSSIKYIDAHDCTALHTVSKPKPQQHTHHSFTFSNCLQLVQTNLFNDIVETHSHCQDNCLQVLSFKMCLPGREIPNWFNHQCSGSSITVQLPPNWLCNQFFGFAICAKFKGADIHTSHLSARSFCTLSGNHGKIAFNFDLLRWRFKIDRFLESDHMFLGYVSWSKYRLVEQGKPINERYYTEATFEIVVENGIHAPGFRTEIIQHCITSCGVRFFTRPKCDHERCEILLATMRKRKRERKTERGSGGVGRFIPR
nr:PREDICTED: protein SUPPRESSOR OF npr1-1, CONSTITUTIVE 1-like [Fragaria vesca subsp. vesca]